MSLDEDSREVHLISSCIEKIEFDYLKAIAEGPGWPVFWIFDLSDAGGREYAERVSEPGAIDVVLAEARSRGVDPMMIHFRMLARPYHAGENSWKGCPAGRFPLVVVTGGHACVIARPVPDGVAEALRKGFLREHASAVRDCYRNTAAQGVEPVAVFVADLSDPGGLRAATVALGEASVSEMGRSDPEDGRRLMVIWAGVPADTSYPEAWGGPIPAGRFAVQVIAEGGFLNETMAAAGLEGDTSEPA